MCIVRGRVKNRQVSSRRQPPIHTRELTWICLNLLHATRLSVTRGTIACSSILAPIGLAGVLYSAYFAFHVAAVVCAWWDVLWQVLPPRKHAAVAMVLLPRKLWQSANIQSSTAMAEHALSSAAKLACRTCSSHLIHWLSLLFRGSML